MANMIRTGGKQCLPGSRNGMPSGQPYSMRPNKHAFLCLWMSCMCGQESGIRVGINDIGEMLEVWTVWAIVKNGAHMAPPRPDRLVGPVEPCPHRVQPKSGRVSRDLEQ
jgi:hypothetical protein